jgi:conjugative transfer signal peptidase TraF
MRPVTLATFLCTGAVVMAGWACGVCWNASASMPKGLWRTVPFQGPLHAGDILTFCPDKAVAELGLSRGYLDGGHCPGGVAPLLKPVAAVPGDEVLIDARGISVNGTLIPHSQPLQTDPAGRPLTAIAEGAYRVGPFSVWIVSGHDERSYDSRYWGPLSIDAVRGRAVPILTGA